VFTFWVVQFSNVFGYRSENLFFLGLLSQMLGWRLGSCCLTKLWKK